MVLKLDPVWLPVVKHNVTKHICLKSSNLTWKPWTGRANSWTVHSWIIIIIIIIIKQSTDRSILKKNQQITAAPHGLNHSSNSNWEEFLCKCFKKKNKCLHFQVFICKVKEGWKINFFLSVDIASLKRIL